MAAEPDTTVASDERTRSVPEPTSPGSDGDEDTRTARDLERLLNRTLGLDLEEVLPEDLQGVLEGIEDRLEEVRAREGVRASQVMLDRVRVMFRMFGAAAEGRTAVPWRSAAGIAGAAVYLANPMEMLPSFLKGDGSPLDDALVIYLAYRLIEQDLERFVEERKHEEEPSGFAD